MRPRRRRRLIDDRQLSASQGLTPHKYDEGGQEVNANVWGVGDTMQMTMTMCEACEGRQDMRL